MNEEWGQYWSYNVGGSFLNLIPYTLENSLVTNINSLEDLRFVGGSPFDLISLEDRIRISVGGSLES